MKPNKKIQRKKKPIVLAGGGFLGTLKGIKAGDVGNVASSGVDLIDNITNLTKTADTKGIESDIRAHGQTTSRATTNEQLMSEWANMSNMQNVTKEQVGMKSTGSILGGTLKGAASGAAIGSVIPGLGTAIGAAVGGIGSLVAGIFGRKKAKKKQAQLNKQVAVSNEGLFNNLSNRVDAIDKQNDFGMASNYFAMGGQTHPQFDNGVNIFGVGNNHEANPLGGIPVSIDPEGNPNLVEQGEVQFNDYIFSNRMKPKKGILQQVGLKDKKATFADIAKSLSKESEERPNDPISQRGLLDSMSKLMLAQEMTRPKPKEGNKFSLGGYAPLSKDHLRIDKSLSVPDPTKKFINLLNNPELHTPVLQQAHNNNKITTLNYAGRGSNQSKGSWVEHLRYAPILGAAYSVASDLAGWSNKPDYSRIDSISSTPVAPQPVGNYLTYNPLDREYHQNKINAQAAASRRAIVNQSGGNRAFATAGLLAADYNALNQTGDMARRAEEYNLQQKHAVEAFNRQTNMFNSQQDLQAQMHNSQQKLRADLFREQMYQGIGERTAHARSLNLTNLFDNIGEVGRETFARNMIVTNPALYYTIDSRGNISYKNTEGLNSNQLQQVEQHAEEEKRRRLKNAPAYTRGFDI